MNGLKSAHGAAHATNSVPAPGPSADDLLARCNALWTELEDFKEYLKTQRREQSIEINHYRSVVKSELKNLERLVAKEQQAREAEQEAAEDTSNGEVKGDSDTTVEPISRHSVASSNLPFLESVWNVTKSTTGLVALQKPFYFGDIVDNRKSAGNRYRRGRGQRQLPVRQHKALTDVVARDGLEWIKVSLLTNHRLLMDKAREGWGGEDSSSEDEESGSDGGANSDSDTDKGIPLVRMAEALAKAAGEVRIRTRRPQLRLVLPKIVEGEQAEVDKILLRLRGLGITVECSETPVTPRPLDAVIDRMLTDPLAGLSETLNMDCTILLALVSDFSHCAVSAEPWFHRALKKQIENEDKENLLPNTLYPAVTGHRMVCTQEAAKRMQEIVETIGTEGERVRTALFMSDDASKNEEDRRRELQEWSKFQVPEHLHLPVVVVDKDGEAQSSLPAIAESLREHLTSINQSVFLFGWAAGYTTITSNKTVVKLIDNVLDKLAESEVDWPKVWMCPTARSLVGKEKGRRE